MTFSFSPPKAPANPGAAPVAHLHSLGRVQALAVLLFRDWFEGPAGRARAGDLFRQGLGSAAEGAILQWADFAEVLAANPRRPLMRHDLTCTCVGADEAVMAHVLALAAEGAREDAMLILSLLVPGDRLLPAMHAAEQAGLAVLRTAVALDRDRHATLH
ncbi:hypothetical protein JSE7799_00994 [Jannaschia seosinensis]|uniref:Uncharacterized protein n=1 Tax=Jannaschia seosinensis TaxID=313367 RepID=A0A0M7B7V5_9RHOB|nr:hypothetical protein [Jannaschia seosinensis]CUH33565.1 hypothetical protein JSE7799_00994 [Jannaschia seosinensis]